MRKCTHCQKFTLEWSMLTQKWMCRACTTYQEKAQVPVAGNWGEEE